VHKDASRQQRSLARDRTNEYRAFVSGLKELPPPPQGETIFFDSMPSQFDENVLLSATQVALRRTDLKAKLVAEFPSEASYRLRFQDLCLLQLPP
jgi:hypothetical protein